MGQLENFARQISSKGNQGTHDIYLVGFPRTKSGGELDVSSRVISPADWVNLIPHLAPEARAFEFVLFGDEVAVVNDQPHSPDQSPIGHGGPGFHLEDRGLKTSKQYDSEIFRDFDDQTKESRNGERSCTASGLEQEARLLLDVAKEQDPAKKSDWRPIIFVAYGLGGLVVKQAMVIANTDPRYCDVALRTHQLVFVATPHNAADVAAWEDILDEMVIAAGIKVKGRRSRVLAELAVSVNKVVLYFHCALKYCITNLSGYFQSSTGAPLVLDELPSFQSCTDENFRLEPGCPQTPRLFTTKKGRVTELDLRRFLYPETLTLHYMWDTEQLEPRLYYANLLDFLQELSPSNRPIYQSTALQVLDAKLDLDVYTRHVSKWQPSKQHSMQVIGPTGYGRATLVKVLVQKVMRYTHDAVLLDTVLEAPETANLDLQTILRSFIHQIVSQRPSLFPYIRPLYLKHRQSHSTKKKDVLWAFLHILLRELSEDWKVVIAASNIHLWPKEVQSSLRMLEELLQLSSSNYLFISSSNSEIPDLCPTSRQILDLGLDDNYRNSFIEAKAKAVLFAQPPMPTGTVSPWLQDIKLPDLSSIGNVELYAKTLSRSILLSTSEAVDAALRDCPKIEDVIFGRCIENLDRRLLGWCGSAISWVQKAARPLRTRELAVAVALDSDLLELAKLVPRIPASIGTDIARHLDVVLRVENDLVHLYNANARRFLSEERPEMLSFQLCSQERLAGLCLQYILQVVSEVPQDVCLAQVTWREQVQGKCERQAELEFLDYAVRHWPAHYLAYRAEHKARAPQGPSEEMDGLENKVLKFLADDFAREKWYRLFCVNPTHDENMSDDSGVLEVATHLGLYYIVESLLSTQVGETNEPAEAVETANAYSSDLGKLLCIAIKYGHSDLVDLFVRKGAKSNDAVLEAAGLGRVNYLEKLLAGEISQDGYGTLVESALYEAAQAGSLSAVKFFNGKSPDWTWKNLEESTFLHAAATGGNVEILKHIMQGTELDLNVRNKDGKSALMAATQLNCALFAEELCKRGADTTLADNEGKTALHYAIINGANIVRLLLQYNVSPATPDKRGQTPLHLACQLGYIDIVILMIKALKEGESVDIRNDNNETPLHIAAACGNSAIVSFLLERSADPLAEEKSSKRTPIDLAAAGGHLEVFEALYPSSEITPLTSQNLVMQSASKGQLFIVRFLLETIDDTNFIVDGKSPLAVAASKGFTEVVRLLLQRKADPNFVDDDGRTPLDRAVTLGHEDVAIMLLRAGADPMSLDKERWTPLHHAALRGMTKMVKHLLDHGATVNARTIMKDTPLHISVSYPEIVKILLSTEPDLAPLNYNGLTPLHIAVTNNYVKTVKLLVEENSALIHNLDEEGRTPLHRSIEANRGSTEVLEILWSKCSKLDLENSSYREQPPILYALREANLEAVRFFLAQYPDMAETSDCEGLSSVHVAAAGGHTEILDELVKASGELDVNALSKDGLSPLHLAASEAGRDTVQKLLDLGANVNAANEEGHTALYSAAYKGRIETTVCLLDAGADPNIHGDGDWSPLHAAADHSGILNVLLLHGAEVNYVAGSSGWTALMRAACWECEEAMETLVRHEANTEVTDERGRTALHIAEREDNPHLSRVLLKAFAKVTATDELGQTPLHYAATWFSGSSAVKVQDLLTKGAVVNCKDIEGDTPLHCAAASLSSSELLIKTLIDCYRKNGLSIDEKNYDQRTPLHQALLYGTFDVSKILLGEGASVYDRDGEGTSCLAMAADGEESKRKVELLLKCESDRKTPPVPWTLDDKVAAFMTALTTDRGAAKALAKDDGKIFQRHNNTFTVLGLCLDSEEHEEAAEFLRRGASPFLHEDGKLSALQHPSLVSYRDSPFLKACLEMLDKELPSPDELFLALRISIERGWTEMSVKIRHLQPLLANADEDGWTIDHFLFQNNRRSSIDHIDSVQRSVTVPRTPTTLSIPGFWANRKNMHELVTLLSDCEVQYLGSPGSFGTASVRADHPIPPQGVSGALYYFEMYIWGAEDAAKIAPVVGVGVCGEFVDMSDGFPGWDTHVPSMGYHGDDGRMYEASKGDKGSKKTGRTYAEGDTVGCGIDWENGSIYYTLNGERVGDYKTSTVYRKMYPVITFKGTPCKVRANFGDKIDGERQEFKFSPSL